MLYCVMYFPVKCDIDLWISLLQYWLFVTLQSWWKGISTCHFLNLLSLMKRLEKAMCDYGSLCLKIHWVSSVYLTGKEGMLQIIICWHCCFPSLHTTDRKTITPALRHTGTSINTRNIWHIVFQWDSFNINDKQFLSHWD